MALATLAEIKAGLGITSTDYDGQITALIDPVSALIEREAGRSFTPTTTFTERHFGGEPTIALRQYPVTSITTVTDKASGEILASTEYAVETATGLLRRLSLGARWAASHTKDVFYVNQNTPVGRWEVVYVAGSTPEDVKLALYYTMSSLVNTNGSTGGMSGFQSESDGDYSYTRAPASSSTAVSGLPSNAIAILSSYKAGVFI